MNSQTKTHAERNSTERIQAISAQIKQAEDAMMAEEEVDRIQKQSDIVKDIKEKKGNLIKHDSTL